MCGLISALYEDLQLVCAEGGKIHFKMTRKQEKDSDYQKTNRKTDTTYAHNKI